MNIEVVYAESTLQRLIALQVEAGTTARQAVLQSGLDVWFPALDLATIPLGIFGHKVKDEQVLNEGDRVELYRPLLADPKEARRRRANKE